MTEVTKITKRLKGLDEFEKPEFVGRMARVRQRRRIAWLAILAATVVVGAALGLILT